MDETQRQLRTGEVSLPMLKFILEYKQQFVQIVEISSDKEKKEKAISKTTLLLHLRETEFQRYTQMQIDLSHFLSYCDQIKKGIFPIILSH